MGKSVYLFVVWSFWLFGLFGCYFFCCLGGGVFFFLLFGRGPRPRPNSKTKNTPPPKQQKKKHVPAPSERVFFAVWASGCVCVFAVWAGGVFFFAVWAGGVFFFCCLGRGVFFFLLFGPGACFFFAVWAGDGSSLTYPSAWLVFKRPNNKRDRTAKKKTRVLARWSCKDCHSLGEGYPITYLHNPSGPHGTRNAYNCMYIHIDTCIYLI